MVIHVAIGILSNTVGEILVAQRPPDKSQSGLWEFPGGKLEKNETAFQALKRELLEEIGVQVLAASPWLQVKHTYPNPSGIDSVGTLCFAHPTLLDIWHVTQFSGEPSGQEGQVIQWVSPKNLHKLPFLAGNRAIIEKILLDLKNRY